MPDASAPPYACSRTLRSEIAAFAIIVDAKDAARAFYERYGFKSLGSAEQRLSMPMAEVARLFAR